MARERSPDRDKAKQIWLDSGGTIKLKDIAAELGLGETQIRKWKSQDKWADDLKGNVTNEPNSNVTKRKGAPKGNKNAVGNKGGAPKGNQNAKGNRGGHGGPYGNDKAVKHGFFRKFLPQDPELLELEDMVQDMKPLEMIWHNITTQFRAIIWAQRVMFVESKGEMVKELKKSKYEIVDAGTKEKPEIKQVVTEEEYEFQFSWDRYATYLKAQSMAMAELRGAIKQFIAAADEKDERRKKLALMQAQVEKVRGEANLIAQKMAGDDDKPIEIVITRKGERS